MHDYLEEDSGFPLGGSANTRFLANFQKKMRGIIKIMGRRGVPPKKLSVSVSV